MLNIRIIIQPNFKKLLEAASGNARRVPDNPATSSGFLFFGDTHAK